ncbi:Lachesin [Sarcoptes scabiei]|uniref:Lachesin n=1 Tax=Sarcoptes scabiei TaxID=52283 RepID=A0A834VGR1_SARSC|nr:Lachesin [Sarcoptes scabiei]
MNSIHSFIHSFLFYSVSSFQDDFNRNLVNENYHSSNQLLPEFVGKIPNITVQIGREARLPCIIKNLHSFTTAWIRDEEKSILTLQRTMVSRDPRLMLLDETQSETSYGSLNFFNESNHKSTSSKSVRNRAEYFVLIIRNIRFSDSGGYMCQINTVPMRSQIGYIRVVIPPEINDDESSNDVFVREGDDVSLRCKAKGNPMPTIEWRREDGFVVPLGNRFENTGAMMNKIEGETLKIARVTRVHSGAWLCIASNGVMPSVSRRILLNVQFAPNIWIPMEEIGALHRSNVTLDCHIEAFPSPINYWTYGPQSKTLHSSDSKFDVSIKEKGYKRHLKLTIRNFDETDVGLYKCNAQNSLGRQVKNVKLYALDSDKNQRVRSRNKQSISNGSFRNRSENIAKVKKRRKKMKKFPNNNFGQNLSSNENLQKSIETFLSSNDSFFTTNSSLQIVINSHNTNDLASDLDDLDEEKMDDYLNDDYDDIFDANIFNAALPKASDWLKCFVFVFSMRQFVSDLIQTETVSPFHLFFSLINFFSL